MFTKVLSDRVEVLNRQIQDLEAKAQSLQLTIDRLSSALAKSEEEEHSQKDKVWQHYHLMFVANFRTMYLIQNLTNNW